MNLTKRVDTLLCRYAWVQSVRGSIRAEGDNLIFGRT